MKPQQIARLAAIGALATLALPAAGQPPTMPFVQNAESLADTAKAEALMAKDHKDLDPVGILCKPMADIRTKAKSYATPVPTKVFDNLYYVGLGEVGAWAITTSDGIILIDTLDNTQEAQTYIVGGLKTLGLDPAQIKYVIVSHGHGDHYGGSKYLQETFHAHVLLSPVDWALMDSYYPLRNGRPTVPPPAHDVDVVDGQKLTLGDTTLQLYITPGHTPGTVSAIIPVKLHGATHLLSFWGGTAFYSLATVADGERYENSLARFSAIARAAGVEGVISNHPVFDGTVQRIGEMAASPDAPNPFLTGKERTAQYYEVLGDCLKADVARIAAATKP
ncbi:MAG: MBL fold metallo-hydrolase [Rhizomicrobium sp.]